MSTIDVTAQAIGRLLEEAHHRTHRGDEALGGGDRALALDEYQSAKSLMEVVCILLDTDADVPLELVK